MFGLLNVSPVFKSFATGETQRTIFMLSPTYIAATNSGVFVYDSSDQTLKKIDKVSTNSLSYACGEIVDMATDGTNIYLLKPGKIEIIEASSLSADANVTTLEYDWLDASYVHIDVALVNSSVMFCVYGSTIDVTIKRGLLDGTDWQIKDYVITPSTTNAEISQLSFAYFDSNTYLVKVDANNIIFYELGDEQNLSRNTPITDIHEEDDILDLYYFDSKLLVVYEDYSTLYNLQNNTSNISASVNDSTSHIYATEDNFDAKNASFNDQKLYLLSSDCYYVLNADTMTFVDKMTNALCIQSYHSNKSQYAYYKVLENTNLISTLGTTSTVAVDANTYVVEIASSTLSDGTVLVGYKYVLFVELYQDEHDIWQYQNHYGYILDDSSILKQIETPSTLEIVKVENNTPVFEYPSVETDQDQTNHSNRIIHTLSATTTVNVISYLGEYKTGINDQPHQVSYALIESNGHIGFIDVSHITSNDQRVINTMPNAKITNGTPVYEEADLNSTIIGELESGKNVRIIGRRDSNGFVKIAYNNDLGYYYEGYVKAYNVRSNSFTTLQIVGTVLVVLNIILLVVLIATRRKITKS